MAEESETLPETTGIGEYRDKIVNGPIIRTLVWLGVPPLVNQLVVVAYNVADSYWLSNYSELAVAVPRQSWPVIFLFQAPAMALTTASLSIVSQYVGAKAYDKASSEASRFFTMAFLTGAVLNLFLLAFRSFIFTWLMATPQEIFEDVVLYSGVISFDILFNYVALTFTTLLQSVGDTRRPAIINVVAVGINVLLDPFLVLGIGPFPRLGVVGAALTDVMGKIISIAGQTYILRKNYPGFRIRFTRDISFDWAGLVLRIGLPVLTLYMANGFAFLMQLRLVNMLGVVVATAFSIGFVILDIVDTAFWGLSGAPAIMIGQSLGANKPKRAKETAFKAALLIFILTAAGAIILYPFARFIADIFADTQNILNETELFLQTVLPTLPFFGLFINAVSTGRGSGHTLFPTTFGMVRLWGFRILLGYISAFTLNMGSLGVWLAIAISNIIGGVAAVVWIKYGNWAKAVIKEEANHKTSHKT